MNKLSLVFLVLLLSACGSKLDGTYSNNITGVAEQKMSFTFMSNGTARMSIGSTTLPIEIPYEVSGNKIKLSGIEGDQIITILNDGDLIMNGLRLTKETVSKQSTAVGTPVQTPNSTPITAPAVVAEPNPAAATIAISEQPQVPTQTTWAPSFDCTKASTFSEKAVCTDTLLGKLDGALSQNYKYMLASDIGDGARSNLKVIQKKWLAERNKCIENQCLASSYRKRMDEICEYPVISGVHPICMNSDEIE